MDKFYYSTIEGKSPAFYRAVALLSLLSLGWLGATLYIFQNGIAVTSLTQQVPWGAAIVMFVFFVGLSVGSALISAVPVLLGLTQFKLFSRVAGFTAILMLAMGLVLLISDWGRPDRLLIPFLNVNPRSILSWNAFIYSGYIANGVLFLWAQFAGKDNLAKWLAVPAIALAIGIPTGSGSIFGVINGRDMYFSSLTPVLFVISALSSGAALAIIMFVAAFKYSRRPLDERLIQKLAKLLAGLIVSVVYLLLVEHIVHLYAPEFQEGEKYILFSGNGFTWIFWGGLIFAGGVAPAAILLSRRGMSLNWIMIASGLHVFGVLCERIVVILPGQFLPQPLFFNSEASSNFLDGRIASYIPNLLEIMQVGGVIAGFVLLFIIGLKIFPFLPTEGRYVEDTPVTAIEAAPPGNEPPEPEAPPEAAPASAE